MPNSLLRGRPALFALAAWAGGIFVERSLTRGDLPGDLGGLRDLHVFISIGILLLCLLASLVLIFRKQRVASTLIIGAAFFGLSFLSAAALDERYLESPIARIARARPAQAKVIGRILQPLERKGDLWQTALAVQSLGVERTRTDCEGTILVSLSADSSAQIPLLREGEEVTLFGELEPLAQPPNPHEYPRSRRLRDRLGAEATLFLHSRFDYEVVDSGDQASTWQQISDWFAAGRAEAGDQIYRAIEDSTARGFVNAVVLGERSDISEETLTDFTRAGVAHILAVSGFNVAIVALLVEQLLRIFGFRRRRLRYSAAMLAVAAYAALVGLEPSVVRALIMIELYYIARFVERKPDALNIVCGAALLTLLFRPFELFDAGFLLSYSAVIGTAILYPELTRHFLKFDRADRPWLYRLGEVSLISVAATLATLPVTMFVFHRFSLAGTVSNIPAIPIASWITMIGFLLVPLMLISPAVARIYGEAVSHMTHALFGITHQSASVPYASNAASSDVAVIATLVVLGIAYSLRGRQLPNVLGRVSIAACALVVVAPVLPLGASRVVPKGILSAAFFDVGQGDCILFHSPAGHTYLVDFGGLSRQNISRAEGIVQPFLQSEGIDGIDAAFITHMHRDHYGGAPYLISNEHIDRIYWTGERVRDRIALKLDSTVTARMVTVERVSAGGILHLEPDLTLYVLYPPQQLVDRRGPSTGENLNDGSLAIKIVYKNRSFLLLGDIEGLDERVMLRRYGDFLHCDVVKVAHHGSAGSSTSEFIRVANPLYAVISVGERNAYGHPAPVTLHRWRNAGANVCRTDRDGAILIQTDGTRIWRASVE